MKYSIFYTDYEDTNNKGLVYNHHINLKKYVKITFKRSNDNNCDIFSLKSARILIRLAKSDPENMGYKILVL